jgi:hypothetical protein
MYESPSSKDLTSDLPSRLTMTRHVGDECKLILGHGMAFRNIADDCLTVSCPQHTPFCLSRIRELHLSYTAVIFFSCTSKENKPTLLSAEDTDHHQTGPNSVRCKVIKPRLKYGVRLSWACFVSYLCFGFRALASEPSDPAGPMAVIAMDRDPRVGNTANLHYNGVVLCT